MNSPWTHAGMPTMSIPGGNAPNGLPLGFQCAAISSTDEELLVWSEKLGRLLARPLNRSIQSIESIREML